VAPEGIAIGPGTTFYVGDLNATGTLHRGDLRTGSLAPMRAADGRPTSGLEYDPRSGYLFAARGSSGWATVFHASSGATIADLRLAAGSDETWINDVIVTRAAAYFTDSMRPVLYRVPLGRAGELLGGFEVLQLSGDFVQAHPSCPGARMALNANGIEATANGEWLIVNNSATGTLYRVDPHSGHARRIDLGRGNVCHADGNLLFGSTLYVMQSLWGRMAVIRLSPDALSGTIADYIVGEYPMTTMARHNASIYAVTAGFSSFPAPAQGHRVVKFALQEDVDERGSR
jgi:sugar lactone lactonase YvrE